jgi:hypothetical protein
MRIEKLPPHQQETQNHTRTKQNITPSYIQPQTHECRHKSGKGKIGGKLLYISYMHIGVISSKRERKNHWTKGKFIHMREKKMTA